MPALPNWDELEDEFRAQWNEFAAVTIAPALSSVQQLREAVVAVLKHTARYGVFDATLLAQALDALNDAVYPPKKMGAS